MKPFRNLRSAMMRGVLGLAVMSAFALPGCKRGSDTPEPGPPVGPSGQEYFVSIYATPSVLPSNTNSTSTITAVLRKFDGGGVAGQNLRFEITDGFNQIGVGTLSQKNVVTDGSGVARTTYTVPQVDVEGFLYVRATWTTAPWTESYWSRIPISLRYKSGPPDPDNAYPVATFTIVTPAPYEVKQEITFDGKESTDPDGIIRRYDWDFGDTRAVVDFETFLGPEPMKNQPIVTHRYQQAGSYVVTLKVTDNQGAYDVEQQIIIIGSLSGLAPTAAFTVVTPSPWEADQTITFDGTSSSDPDGAIRRWDWDWGDGKYTYNGGRIVTHAYHEDGSYPVTLTVTDDSGLKGVASQNVLIGGSGLSPIAAFTYTPTNPARDTVVVFDASTSTDSDGAIRDWDWDFGDGSHGSGMITQHVYGNDGVYFVILTVTDDSGMSGVATASVMVGGAEDPNAPTACFTVLPSTDVQIGDKVKFDGSCSDDSDDGGVIMTWRWMFGDSTTGHESIITHVYTYSGVFVVFLTVTDDEGLTDVAYVTMTVSAGDPPVANAGSDQSFTGLTCPGIQLVAFSGAASTDADGSIVSYYWDFGDGSTFGPSAFASTTHTYTLTSDVTRTVYLTVTDDDGMTNTDSITVLLDCT